MVNLSLMILASGAKQLVVQEALLQGQRSNEKELYYYGSNRKTIPMHLEMVR